jgi:hypothetical protein
VSKPVQGVFIGMGIVAGVWGISALSLPSFWDRVATGAWMIVYTTVLMYWNKR